MKSRIIYDVPILNWWRFPKFEGRLCSKKPRLLGTQRTAQFSSSVRDDVFPSSYFWHNAFSAAFFFFFFSAAIVCLSFCWGEPGNSDLHKKFHIFSSRELAFSSRKSVRLTAFLLPCITSLERDMRGLIVVWKFPSFDWSQKLISYPENSSHVYLLAEAVLRIYANCY